jgi:hypothetical protein
MEFDTGFYLEEVAVEEWVGVPGLCRLEDGKRVFELTDAVAHLCDLLVQFLGVCEYEAEETMVRGGGLMDRNGRTVFLGLL